MRGFATPISERAPNRHTRSMTKVTKTEEEWRRELTPEQYRVLRE